MGASLSRRPTSPRWRAVGWTLAILVVSYFTYVHRFWDPPHFFWDENYHVASAQKYLHRTFFMEPHPPLGKLLIALGEAIVSPQGNGAADQFLGTDRAEDTPVGFSFAGYRLAPTLLAWWVAPVLFWIFVLLTRSYFLAAMLASLYVFDNALIVHSRSAMLEPIQLFLAATLILLFLLVLERRDSLMRSRVYAVLFGACLAAIVTTKITGLVLGLLYVPWLWVLSRGEHRARAVGEALGCSAVGFVVVFVAVWHTHFALGSSIQAELPDQGYYQASDEYKRILQEGANGSIRNFPVMLRDSFRFVGHYQRGVPRLDLCKEGENGSPWFVWPIGARAINYRWETTGGGDSASYRYLYLQTNPAVWFLGLAGVFLAATLLLGSVLMPLQQPLRKRFRLVVFLALWVGYMLAISRVDRVMYLYHYFLPLLFSFLLLGLVVVEIQQIAGRRVEHRHRVTALGLCVVVVFGSFWFYRPLTYYHPITDGDFMKRSLVRMWDLRCVRCDPTSPLVGRSCS